MNRESSLIKSTLILTIGRLIPKLAVLITLPIITQSLSKEHFGIYDLINSVVMLLMPILTVQVQSAAFRFLIDARDNKDETTKIITNTAAITLMSCLIVIPLSYAVFARYRQLNGLLVTSYLMIDGIYTITAQVCRGLGKNRVYSEGAVILSVVNCIGTAVVLLVLRLALDGVLLILLLSNLAALVYTIIRVKLSRYINIHQVSLSFIKKLIAYSWPMIPNNLSTWVLTLSDRLVITKFLGINATAVYAAANKVPNMLSLAQNVIVMAWQENASMAVNDSDSSQYFSDIFKKIFRLMIGITATLIGVTPLLFRLLIRGDYESAYLQMPILILAMFFFCMSSIFGGIYIAHKKTLNIGITTTGAAVINLLVDLLLVNHIGIAAGSVSTLIAYCALCVFRMIDSRKYQPMDFDYKEQVVLISIIILMLIICMKKNFYLNLVNAIVGITLMMLLNLKLIGSLIGNVKEKIN